MFLLIVLLVCIQLFSEHESYLRVTAKLNLGGFLEFGAKTNGEKT